MQEIIRLKNVSYKYDETEQIAVNNVSLSVNSGEWVAIVGSNGSGKSTLVRMLNGLITATAGEITIAGDLLDEKNIFAIRRNVGMVFQNPDNQFVGATVENDVAFGLENLNIPRAEMQIIVENMLKQVNMWEFKNREPASLSGGQKQRVALASVLAMNPSILILDEATSMLDPKGRYEVIQTLTAMRKQRKMTVISITHDLDEIALADRVIVMDNGEIKLDTVPKELFNQGQVLYNYGLTLPFTAQVKENLEELGLNVLKEYQTETELAKWIQSLDLKM